MAPTIAGVHGDTAIELLLFWVFDASEQRRTITRSTLLQQLERIGIYLSALRDYSAEWNVAVGPLRDEDLSPSDLDSLRDSKVIGYNTNTAGGHGQAGYYRK